MSTFDYAGIAATAAQVLAQFGKNVTLRQYTTGTYNPATGVNTVTSSDSIRKGAMFDFKEGTVNGPGGLVLQGDKKLIMEAGVVPSIQHKIIDVDGTEYAIVGIGEIKPASTPVAYILHLRR